MVKCLRNWRHWWTAAQTEVCVQPAFPPGPPGHFLWGHLQAYRTNLLQFEREAARQYGDVVRLRFGLREACLISHPDDIYQVLVGAAGRFRKSVVYRALLGRILGEGLLTSEGALWQRQRRLAQPAFHHRRIQGYASVMTAEAERLLAEWRPDAVRAIDQDMMRLTLAVVARTLFSTELQAEADRVAGALNAALELADTMMEAPVFLPAWLPTARNRRQREALRTLDEIVYGMVAQHRAAGDGEASDLLSMLLAARDETGAAMSDRQVRDEAVTLVLAGHETTANALTWAWCLLAQHPEAEARLLAELQTVLGGRRPTPEDVPKLTYTQAVFKETMRLYPPIPTIGREALSPVTLGGYPLRAGTIIVIAPHVVHRDPRWFAEPERFDPERFLPATEAARPKLAYLPFGGGPRVCIGNAFAEMEAVLILATLAQRFQLQLTEAVPAPSARLTLRPSRAVRMRLTPRPAAA